MLAVFDFVPTFCPNCGSKMNYNSFSSLEESAKLNRKDYLNYNSATCNNCPLKYQYTTSEAILFAADEVDGDLRYYNERDNR